MLFWTIAALISLAVIATLTRAALRGTQGDVPPAAFDLQVYRDQLKEVDRDLARGVIGEGEAERIRTEVSRRILAADTQLKQGGSDGGQPASTAYWIGGAALLSVLGGGLLVYQQLGTPGYNDVPIAARIAASNEKRANRMTQAQAQEALPLPAPAETPDADFLQLMERLRATLKERPDDIQGLSLLARNEPALGNFDSAINAQERIIALRGEAADPADHTYLAELNIRAASGYVSQEAEAALREALTLDPDYPFALYYLAQYLMQVDRPDAAFRTMERLLEISPPGAPWIAQVRGQIEDVAWRAGVKYELPAEGAAPGPSAADVAAAQDMTEEERNDMIRGMVGGLAARLAEQGGPPEDWARLIQAQGVLGETAQAMAIWEEAQQVFAQDARALRLLEDAARAAEILQ